MKFIVKFLIVMNLLFSLNSKATADKLKTLVEDKFPEFCDKGTFWRKTIRSESGSYCTHKLGASLAVYICDITKDSKNECANREDSEVKNLTKEEAKKHIENNIKDVCETIAVISNHKIFYNACQVAIMLR